MKESTQSVLDKCQTLQVAVQPSREDILKLILYISTNDLIRKNAPKSLGLINLVV